MDQLFLMDTIEALSSFTETPGEGVTRFSWSEADRMARFYLSEQLESMGLVPWTDGIGNLRATMKGKQAEPTLVIGSHLDSVRNGGRLDGAYGVAAALAVLQQFHSQGELPPRDIEFIAFAEEEGSNFGSTCLGSKAITGLVSVDALKSMYNAEGVSAYEVLIDFGLHPEKLPQQQIQPDKVAGFLEVHIEQNSVLEGSGTPLGVVTAISAMQLASITFRGTSRHAASPIEGRQDPMMAFGEFIMALEALRESQAIPQDLSYTVGKIEASPNVGIVIPETVTFTLDLRHIEVPVVQEVWRKLECLLSDIAQSRGVQVHSAILSQSGGVKMSSQLMGFFEEAALNLGVTPLFLTSGPAHDAAPMGNVVPTALLFVPSIHGLSHCPQESTSPEHLALGAKVLKEVIGFFED